MKIEELIQCLEAVSEYEKGEGENIIQYENEFLLSNKDAKELLKYIQQKENKEKEIREYIEKNWISQKDADNYRFDDEELDIEISDIAVLFDILDKEVN